MHIKLIVTAAALLVDVTVKNETAEPLYLANWIFDYFGVLEDPAFDVFENKDAPPTR